MVDLGSIPELGRVPGEGNGNPLQYSCLGIPMGRGAWQATVHVVTEESDTTERLNQNTVHMLYVCAYGYTHIQTEKDRNQLITSCSEWAVSHLNYSCMATLTILLLNNLQEPCCAFLTKDFTSYKNEHFIQ